jgi:hypothetical protein
MPLLRAPWTTWWQADLPCYFTREAANGNCAFLVDTIGKEWLQRSLAPRSGHPLIAEWMTKGANSFLLLNALAEDLRLLVSVSRIDDVLKDLRHPRRCRAAWHVIKAAAMFQRGGATVLEFFAQSNQKVPDFSVRFNSAEANVEAKLLTESDVEVAFTNYASPLVDRLLQVVIPKNSRYRGFTIIVKDSETLPDVNEVVDAVVSLLDSSSDELKTTSFNIFPGVEPFFYILCPRSEKENIRVEARVRQASEQLLSDTASDRPGILWVGVTEQQDPLPIRERLAQRFDRNRFDGVGAAILSRAGTHLTNPRRSVIDLLTTIVNPKSRCPLPMIPIKPLDLYGSLDKYLRDGGIPVYRVGKAVMTVGTTPVRLHLPDIRRIKPELLP